MTRVALPPTFALGFLDVLKAQGMQLWKEHGLWGGRSLAAQSYNLANRYPPGTWDWAATSLDTDVPSSLWVARPIHLGHR